MSGTRSKSRNLRRSLEDSAPTRRDISSVSSRKRTPATLRLGQLATLGVLLGGAVFGTAAAVYAADGTGTAPGVDPLPTVSALPSPVVSAPAITDPTGLLTTAPPPSDSPSPTPSASDSPTPPPSALTGTNASDSAGLGSSNDVGTSGQITSSASASTSGKTTSVHQVVKTPDLSPPAAKPGVTQRAQQSVAVKRERVPMMAFYPHGLSASTLHMLQLTSPLLSAGPLTQVGSLTASPPLLAGLPLVSTPALTPIAPSADHRPTRSGVTDPVFDVGVLTVIAAAAVAARTRVRMWRGRRLAS